MKSYLLLSDGTRLEGNLQGCICSAYGEIVFNTGMTGYQEIVTDPSYFGQIVVLTYPMIGNYGTDLLFDQSKKIQVKGLVVKSLNDYDQAFLDYLKAQNIPVLTDVDTRHLTKHIRNKGAMMSQIVVDQAEDFDALEMLNPVYQVTTSEIYDRGNGAYKVAVLDFGIKEGILKQLEGLDVQLKVFPANTCIETILSYEPDGLFLSNGPGNPAELSEIVDNVKILSQKMPTFGICLGHQLLGLAYGAKTEKLLFGHRGSNQPVKDLVRDKVVITSQNHGFGIEKSSMENLELELTHVNVNDGSVEGFKHKTLPIFSVQYHPEASPGPDDSHYLFTAFETLMEVSHDQ